MDSAWWQWRLAGWLVAACILALGGCPADDDDSADDDAGDDDAGDDDMTLFSLEQDLAGTTSGTPCPSCDYTFDVTYTTVETTGTCIECRIFPDGTWTLAYDSDYLTSYPVVLLGTGGQWYFWYYALLGEDGHTFAYEYDGAGYTQTGYWDVAGGNASMTGKAINTEP